jgi:uncharacterized protein YjbJ (UPF0337 family)
VSGGFLRIKLADGDEYEMPEQEAFSAMADLEKRGVNFDATEAPAVRGDVKVGEPEVIKSPPPIEAPENLEAEKAHVLRMLQDPAYFGKQLAGAGGKYLGAMVGGAGGAAEGLLANAGRQGVAGGIESGSAAVAQDKGPWQVAQDTLFGGGTSAAGAGLLDGIGRGVGKLGEGAGWLADKARNVVAGVGAKEARAVMDKHGLDAADQLGRNLEELVPPRLMGRSSRGYAEELQKQLGDEAKPAAGTLRGDLRDVYQTAGKRDGVNGRVPDAQEQLRNRVEQEAAALSSRALTDEDAHRAAALQRLADRLGAQTEPGDLSSFVRQKSGMQAAGHSGAASTVPDQASAWAAARGGRINKEELDGIMTAGARGDTEMKWRELSDKMAKAATLEELTRQKAGAEITAGDVGTALLGGAVGAGAGYLGSQMTDGDDTAGAMAVGTGLGGALFSGSRNAFRQAAGSWGSDVAANTFRGLERNLGGAARNMTSAAQNVGAPTGFAVSELARALEEQRKREEEEAGR